MKKLIVCALVLIMTVLCVSALPKSAEADDYSSWWERVNTVPSFKFTNHKDGIGWGN